MSEVIATKNTHLDEREDIQEIIQLSLFDNITHDDIRKTIWLLGKYAGMTDIIKNYEYVLQEEAETGINEYALSSAEGRAKKLDASDVYANLPANTIILKEQRHENYLFYKRITNRVRFAINNIRDPHQHKIMDLLFIEGWRYGKAQDYMEKGMRKNIPPIYATTFAEKRRVAIKSLANSFKINGTLDFVIIHYGAGRNTEGEIGLLLPHPSL